MFPVAIVGLVIVAMQGAGIAARRAHALAHAHAVQENGPGPTPVVAANPATEPPA